MNRIKTLLKYMDIFGTKYTFYSDKKPKLYTVTGGILSIASIFFCILIPIFFSLDDLNRNSPITTISSIISDGYPKIKFDKEKIWIPWRILDYNDNIYLNNTELLFPVIYYINGSKNEKTKKMNIKKLKINYKFCNETSMANRNSIYRITIPLEELYCIDMDGLDIGGSWITDFINYIQFDLYYCREGIKYNESNSKYTSFNKIINTIGFNNSIKIAFYYPIVQFQPNNEKEPIIIIYKPHFFHLSKYTNKIESIFLKENILTDDFGWIIKNEKNSTFWGLNSITGDNYFIGDEKYLMNEGNNSIAYSLNIYLEPGIIHYKRYYKKLNSILADILPISYIIFFVFKYISKLFKFTEGNRKIIELLFENLKEKPKKHFEDNYYKLKMRNATTKGRLSFNSFNNVMNKEEISLKNKKKTKISFDTINHKSYDKTPSINLNKRIKPHLSLSNIHNLKASNKFLMQNKKTNAINDMSNQNLIYSESNKRKDCNLLDDKNNKIKMHKVYLSDKMILPKNINFVKGKLFPYKYYLFSVFIKNLNISKGNFFFSSRFAKVYAFLCQLFDVTTYLTLQREFSVLKNIISEKNQKLIENYNKINVNSKNFLKDISYCIGEKKLNILAQGVRKKVFSEKF